MLRGLRVEGIGRERVKGTESGASSWNWRILRPSGNARGVEVSFRGCQKLTCCVVPDEFNIRRLGLCRKAQIDLGIASGEHCVLALAVDAEGRCSDSKLGSNQRRSVMVAVRLLNALAEPQRRQIFLLIPSRRSTSEHTRTHVEKYIQFISLGNRHLEKNDIIGFTCMYVIILLFPSHKATSENIHM